MPYHNRSRNSSLCMTSIRCTTVALIVSRFSLLSVGTYPGLLRKIDHAKPVKLRFRRAPMQYCPGPYEELWDEKCVAEVAYGLVVSLVS